MKLSEQESVFDDIELPGESSKLKFFKVFFLGLLILISLFFCIAGAYFFYITSRLPNVVEIYKGNLINEFTIPLLIISIGGLITLSSGIFFLFLKRFKSSIWALLIGNLITFVFSLYN
jgi:hypothetical protein